jgi:phosphoribosylanthranilate isomerase
LNSLNYKQFIVKICGLTTARDTVHAVQSGASAIGFNFYPKSKRFLSLDQARTLSSFVPPTIAKVGIFVDATLNHLLETLDHIPLDVLQLHGAVPNSLPAGVRIWRALPVTPQFQVSDLGPEFETYLLDSPTPRHGGSGQAFDWSRARSATVPVVLAGGLNPLNVARAIEVAEPWGVDACSGLESSPGHKDPEKVKVFVEVARKAFSSLAHGLACDGRHIMAPAPEK